MATQPISGPSAPAPAPTPTPSARPITGGDPSPAAVDLDAEAVVVDVAERTPPSEVLAAIARASANAEDLAARGLSVAFNTDPASGRLTAELQDHTGTVRSALTPSQVLGLAEGRAPEQTRKSHDVHQQRQPDHE